MDSAIFIKMIELFVIIILGYCCSKAGVLNATVKASLSKLILSVAMPCTILASVMKSESLPDAGTILRLLIVSMLTYVVLFALAKLTSLLLHVKGSRKGAVEFGIMFSNVGFIGFPVTQAIFGNDAIFYTSVFNMPFNLLCYSLGIIMLSKQEEEGGKLSASEIKQMMKSALNPGLFSAVIALILAFLKIQGPAWLGDTVNMVGQITTPGALLIIGMALSEMPLKEMFNNVQSYLVSVVSVVITPLVMYYLFRPFTASDPLLLGVLTVIAGMPTATAGTMLCVNYGGDEKFMAQITFLTTLFSVITIPLLSTLLI